MMTEEIDLETRFRMERDGTLAEHGINYEVETEEQAKAYMEFLDQKMEKLASMQVAMAKAEAERYEAEMSKQPRSVRRMFLKKKTKFSEQFKIGINKK